MDNLHHMAKTYTNKKPDVSKEIEYLVIGHVTKDLTESGSKLGGTATFSGLTAKSLGLKTGIITSFTEGLDISSVDSLWIRNKNSQQTSTFKNISDGKIRKQFLYKIASPIEVEDVPPLDPPPMIVHLGPVADEVNPNILNKFPHSLKCLTPQGWFRKVNDQDQVELKPWENSGEHLKKADIAVISLEDVQRDEEMITHMASSIPVFVVTENYLGARIYWHNDARFIKAPGVKYVDDTGAGDIFAAAFFYRYYYTKDPWEAGRFAVFLASCSVTRNHLKAIPTREEIIQAKMEIINF